MKNCAFALLGMSMSLAGCGGGSDGQSVSFQTTPIRVFIDDSGVAKVRAVLPGTDETGYIIAPELALFLNELESANTVQPYDYSTLPIVASGPNTTIRGGEVNENGVILYILAAVTLDEDAALVLIEEPISGFSALISSGFEATGLPSSGTASYSGSFGMQYYADLYPEIGTFTATANFDNPTPTVDFSGSTTSNFNGAGITFTTSGTAVVDGNSFSSTTMTINDSGVISVAGSMNGDFHGIGGNSIAGVIYSNDSFGDYRGGFVGSQ